MVALTTPLSPIVTLLLFGYFIFSIWNAYSTGYTRGLHKKSNTKGLVSLGPYLSLAISFFGVMLALFLFYELVAYYSGYIKVNLPAELSNLSFLNLVIRQFSSVQLSNLRVVFFLGFGLLLSGIVSYLFVIFVYRKGLSKSLGSA